MCRLAFSLLTVLLLAACAGAPQKTSRGSGGSNVVANGGYHAPPPGFPNFVDHSIGREEISIQAMSLVGIPYRWGGNTPDSGFDCSGLVRYVVLRAASVNLPRTTADISERGESIEPDGIAPGDLIFFNTTGRAHSHVGIYVGKLRFVNAPSTGGTVRLDYLTNPYWARRFDGIRRVAGPAAAPAPFDTPSYQAAAPQPERVAPGAQTAPAYAGATATTPIPTAQASASDATVGSPAQPATAARAVPQTAVSHAPDAIDAAADAFEPPPPASVATRQAQQAQAQAQQAETNGGVQIMRASTSSRGMPAPTQTNDDPIARFANGNF
ncbi:hypothetical protein LMG28614_01538 [Paraburkholderia ultramafica]|uniref:NlpC/P60 domain-containing protein n=1 Tax=Paraburkholderia ultramafica TaxID=1544867 RepID=A0A6S7B1V9_9BURK|nr:C40 family peptidase [Paraburkholderia ultramafica]CAB3782690.1 hypothetical protein LMG28614_01538 [Paraburkholderia ultramafica]